MEWSEEELAMIIYAVGNIRSIQTDEVVKQKFTDLLEKLMDFKEMECDQL